MKNPPADHKSAGVSTNGIIGASARSLNNGWNFRGALSQKLFV